MLIDDLLKLHEFDIYNNTEIPQENFDKLAQIIFGNNLDFEKIFDYSKCPSKHCWKNFIKIFEAASNDDKKKGIPMMISLLQDSNWPAYQDAIKFLLQFEDEILNPYIIKYLRQAYQEDDEMWIENIIRFIKVKYKSKMVLQQQNNGDYE